MPLTPTWDIYYADTSTPLSIEDITAAMADSVEDALDVAVAGVTDARQIQTYKWADATARAAQTGMTEGDIGDQADTEQRWRYSGSAWVNITTGLFPIIPTAAAGSGVSIGASGKVTLAAATTASFTFASATYDNYFFKIDTTQAGTSDIRLQLRSGGTTLSTNTYDYIATAGSAATTTTGTVNAISSWGCSQSIVSGGISDIRLTLSSPFLAVATTYSVSSNVYTPSTFVPLQAFYGGANRNAVSYDGVTFTVSAGSLTGSIRVYGYNNN